MRERGGHDDGSGVGWLRDAAQNTPALRPWEPDRHWRFASPTARDFFIADFYLPSPFIFSLLFFFFFPKASLSFFLC